MMMTTEYEYQFVFRRKRKRVEFNDYSVHITKHALSRSSGMNIGRFSYEQDV